MKSSPATTTWPARPRAASRLAPSPAGEPANGVQLRRSPHGRRELGGVLTQAAIMAGLSDGRESNPVKRGAWLARKIVAEPPHDPRDNVPPPQDGATEHD